MVDVSLGQRVRILLGIRTVSGTVVEDRGPVGVGGRRLFVVAVPNDPEEPDMLVRAEDELEQDTTQVEPLTLNEIQQFLETGGLVSILRRNMSGGKNQPTVWLCRDSLGNVTYTFEEERGLAGGRRVPLSALHGDRIFAPKLDEVVEYVTSFGVPKRRSLAVVEKIRWSPN